MQSYLPKELLIPDITLRPVIHMSPFSGKFDFHANGHIPQEADLLNRISTQLFGQPKDGRLTKNGRHALSLALQSTVRNEAFVVSIITPSGSGYVSACVTAEINKYCKWVFGYEPKADIYLLIHEFGRKALLPEQAVKSRKPVIEDCAYALVDPLSSSSYGVQGHYIIFSLSKALPIQYGGLFFVNGVPLKENLSSTYLLSDSGRNYLQQILTAYFQELSQANQARLHTYRLMQQISKDYRLNEAYPAKEGELPHAFLVEISSELDASSIKIHMNLAGIESGIFEGGNAYFLPCHQNMNMAEIEYIFYHLCEAINNADL
jgi:hypothetical protein